MGFLSGKSKSKSSSGNSAYPFIQDSFGGSAEGFGDTTNALGNILGLGGSGAHAGAMNDYWKSSGGDFLLNQGLDDVTARMSQMGLRQSGAHGKAMEDYRQGLASTKLDNYLGQLRGLGGMQLGAGGLISQAGQWSKGESSQKEGLGGLIGSLASAFAMSSARELKTNIELIRRSKDGLGWYRFAYKSDPSIMLEGAMADEVEKLRPWAFIPHFTRDGKPGVNMALLGAV